MLRTSNLVRVKDEVSRTVDSWFVRSCIIKRELLKVFVFRSVCRFCVGGAVFTDDSSFSYSYKSYRSTVFLSSRIATDDNAQTIISYSLLS